MMRQGIILLTFMAFLCGKSISQEEPRNFIGASFGGSDFHLRDDHASPLIFSRLGIAPALQYYYRGDESRHYVDLSYDDGNLETTNDAFFVTTHRARIRYTYVHALADFDFVRQPVAVVIGGSVTSYLSHADYYYFFVPPTIAKSIESWYWSNSVDLSLQCECRPSPRECFSLQLFVPIVSNVSRPTYSPRGDFNNTDNDCKFKLFGKTTVFPKNFSLNAMLAYQRPLFGSFDLQISYEFFYAFYAEPREVNLYMNNFRGGVYFCF